MNDSDEHGTYAGYLRHRRGGTKPCDECRKARNVYMREYRSRPGVMDRHQRRRSAGERAFRKLAALHPDEYEALVLVELKASKP